MANPFAQFAQPAANPFAAFAAAPPPPPPGMRAVQPGEIPTESGYYALPTEEPQRTMGERVLGAVAAPLDVALTLGSGAARGLAAPIYGLVTGRGEAGAREVLSGIRQPQTPEARAMLEAVAPALQGLPPVIGVGLPQAMSAGPAAARQAGRAVGQEAALVQGAIEAPLAARRERQALQRSAADWARAPQIEAANRATELGIALNPAVSNPNVPNRIRSTLVGSRDINASLAAQNMPKWTELAKRDMELPAQTTLDAKAFEQARRQVSGPYEQLRRMGTLQASQDTLASLDNLRIEQATIGGEAAAKRVNRLVDDAQAKLSAGLTGDQLLENIRQMRRDAQAIRDAQKAGQAPSPQKLAEADTKMQLANVLETVAEENIFDPRFLGAFREARAKMAKTYAYQDATDFNTGRVDPTAIAKLTQQDNALTGIIADIGAIAGNFPEIAVSSAPANFAQQRLTRSGIMGTVGAGLGAVTPVGIIGGGLLGATAGEIYTGLRARKMGTPEYQQRFARPEDRRIFPNDLAPPPANALTSYVAPQTILTPEDGAFVTGAQPTPLRRSTESGVFAAPFPTEPTAPPTARFVGPEAGPPQLPAPSAEATMDNLRRIRGGEYTSDVIRAQTAEARQAAAEAAARQPARGGTPLVFDEMGNLVPERPTPAGPVAGAETALQSAARKLAGEMVTPTETQFRRVSTGKPGPQGEQRFYVRKKVVEGPSTREPQAFALTADEKIAWDKAKADLVEVVPGMRALTDEAIAGKLNERKWVENAVADTRRRVAALDRIAQEKEAAFAQIADRAKAAQKRREAVAERERLMDALELLEQHLGRPRPQPSGGQGPKTREFQRNRLVEQQTKNRLIEP